MDNRQFFKNHAKKIIFIKFLFDIAAAIKNRIERNLYVDCCRKCHMARLDVNQFTI